MKNQSYKTEAIALTPNIKKFYKRSRRKKLLHYQRVGEDLSYSELKTRRFIKKQLINSNGCICGICGKPILDMKDCTIDHIIPLSKGGLTTLENCQLAHYECNQEKADM